MINIAICDDELHEQECSQYFLKKYIQKNPRYESNIVCFSAPLDLLAYVESQGGFDIFILDIYMAGMLGTDLARQLRELDDHSEIIFLTTSKAHSMEAFEVYATQYLIKPITELSFFSALDKVFKRLNIEQRHVVTLKTSDGIVRLFTRNVIFTETGKNNYQIIHTVNKEKIEVRMTSTELFELLLPTRLFVRCGASININLKFVRQIKKDAIIFDSGEQLTYPYRAYQKLKEAFLSFQMDLDQ